jgi:ATP-dependent RNA helicase SUPV3L1/SUV3
VGELLHLAASGRTSIPVDKETPKALYRTAGYRICGERAVRVDILERLADLIRPALSWREGAPGPKPDGFFDGRSFLVSGAMTSLTGASGEDFASILRSLGYRMDRKPKPVEAPATPETAAAAPSAVVEATPASEAPVEPLQIENAAAASVTDVPSRSLLPEPEFVPAEAAPSAQVPAQEAVQEPAPAETEAAAPVAEAKAAEEPAFIEAWRPAGRSERRPHRPRRPHRQQQSQVATTDAVPAASAAGESPAAPSADVAASPRGPHRPRRARGEEGDREKRQERHDRQQRLQKQGERTERQEGRPRGGRPRRERGENIDRADRERYYAKPFGNSGGRDKQPDPNSPFAKLAALKQQLEQSGKDPS